MLIFSIVFYTHLMFKYTCYFYNLIENANRGINEKIKLIGRF
jgi:hypothetical protein